MLTKSHNPFFLVLLAAALVESKVVEHTFVVSYISGSPDGVLTSSILGINGKFPGPVIEAEVGDTLRVTVRNEIQDRQNVTIHWHGIHQRGTPFEDGPSQITQCPIKSGRHQVYQFPVTHAGTYWYHSHVNSQYTEGLWGILIVRGRVEVWRHQFSEILITLNDWYHTSGHANEAYLLSNASRGAPPYPSSALMNGMGRYPCDYAKNLGRQCNRALQRRPVFHVLPGATYRLRLVNTGGWTAFNFTINGHTLRPVEVDGVETNIGNASQAVHIANGQRYSFLLTIPKSGRAGQRFLIRASIRKDFLFTLPFMNINRYPEAVFDEVTGILEYSSNAVYKETSEQFDHTESYPISRAETWSNLNFVKELSLTPFDKTPSPYHFDRNFTFTITFHNDPDGIRRGSFNHRPADLSAGMPQLAKMIHGITMPDNLYPVYIRYGEIIQVVVNNPETGPHPIHLHGHHFWVTGMGKDDEGDYDPRKHVLSHSGLRRDTILVKQRSWLVLRFKADNVGVWTMHCHVDWHVRMGMSMTFVEAPERASTLRIPAEAKRVCADHGVYI